MTSNLTGSRPTRNNQASPAAKPMASTPCASWVYVEAACDDWFPANLDPGVVHWFVDDGETRSCWPADPISDDITRCYNE